MMMRKTITLMLSLLGWVPCLAQLTLEECYRKARENYPLVKQYGLIEKTKDYNVANAGKGYLPQVAFSAQATYQSDVTEIPIDFEQIGLAGIDIPTLDKAQYGATLEVSQTLWDGGAIRSEQENARAQADVELRDLDVNLYALHERVNQLYFGILLVEAQTEQNRLLQEELQQQCDRVASYVRNGVASQADWDALRVDLLKAKQDEAQCRHVRRAYAVMLGQLIGEDIGEETELVKPEAALPAEAENCRPELALFDAQIRQFEALDRRVHAGVMPQLGLFVRGGVGKPGLDMLSDDFKAYYLAGVRLSWNLGAFYTKKNERRKIETGIRGVETQRETFLFNTSLDAAQRNSEIDRYAEQLKYDDEIIALRESVKRASEKKMAEGTLSGTDLTRDIRAEQSARLDKIRHEIEWLLAVYNLKYVMNY